jgi:hypothetical protein
MRRLKLNQLHSITLELYMNEPEYSRVQKEQDIFLNKVMPLLVDYVGSSGRAKRIEKLSTKEVHNILRRKFRMVKMILNWTEYDFNNFEKQFFSAVKSRLKK